MSGFWILVAVVIFQSFWIILLTKWLSIVEGYALDLHNYDINDIRHEIWKIKREDK